MAIKPIPDSEVTTLSNGEPLEITQTVYDRAPRGFKWCPGCYAVTRHIRVKDPFKGIYVELCDAEID